MSESYRERDVGDVMTAFVFAALGGIFVGGVGFALSILLHWSWPVPLAIWFGVTGVLYFVTSGPHFLSFDTGIVTRTEQLLRKDLNGDGVIGTPKVYAVRSEVKRGKFSRYSELGLLSEDQAWAWHKFCKAVHEEGKNFSVNEAVSHGMDPSLAAGIIRSWAVDSRFVLKESVGPRKTPELTPDGELNVRRFAEEEPPE